MSDPMEHVTTMITGHQQAQAAEAAANTQAAAATQAAQMQLGEFNQIQQQEKPYMDIGVGAANTLGDLMGTSGNTGAADYGSLIKPFDADTFKQYNDPGYQFQLQQGSQGVMNSAAANGSALSGAALKDLIGYNQGMANTAYQSAFNRYQTQQGNIYQRLASLASLGQNAASNTGSQGLAATGQAGQDIIGGANAQAAGDIGYANAYANANQQIINQHEAGMNRVGQIIGMFAGGG